MTGISWPARTSASSDRKEPNDRVERILSAPRTGTYQLGTDGQLTFLPASHDWHQLAGEDECFFRSEGAERPGRADPQRPAHRDLPARHGWAADISPGVT